MSTELTDGRTSIVRAISLKLHKRLLALGIIVLAMCLIAPASAFAEGEVSRAAEPDFAAIDAFIQEDMREVRIPGLALGIVHGDKLVHLESFGEAAPSGRAVTPQMPFILASVIKSFTALAIMQLSEEGKVDLDAPVKRYLPLVPRGRQRGFESDHGAQPAKPHQRLAGGHFV